MQTRPLANLGHCSDDRPKEAERNNQHVWVQGIQRTRIERGSIIGIARIAGVSEPTARKYPEPQGLSLKMPMRKVMPTLMDPYADIVNGFLEADMRARHKQHHTAKRIWESFGMSMTRTSRAAPSRDTSKDAHIGFPVHILNPKAGF